jgi:hypothetical protein
LLASTGFGDRDIGAIDCNLDRRQIDIEHLTKIEESGRTIDIEPHHHLAAIWSNPIVITLLILCGLSFLANMFFLIVTMK